MFWLETGKCSNDSAQWNLDAMMFLGQAHIRESVARVVALVKAGQLGCEEPDLALDYFGGDAKGEYCKLDGELVALPGASQADTADLGDTRFPEDHYRLTREYLIRPKTEWPSRSELLKNGVHLWVRKGHYSDIVNRMSSVGMVVFVEPGEGVFENSFFGCGRKLELARDSFREATVPTRSSIRKLAMLSSLHRTCFHTSLSLQGSSST